MNNTEEKNQKHFLNLVHSSSSHNTQRQTDTCPLHASLSFGNKKYLKMLTGTAEDALSSYSLSVGLHISLSQTLFIFILRAAFVIKKKRLGNSFKERIMRKREQLLFLYGL